MRQERVDDKERQVDDIVLEQNSVGDAAVSGLAAFRAVTVSSARPEISKP